MHQVFTNLLSNAIKYSPDNSAVGIKIFLEEEKHFHIVVTDRGIGIDKKELKKIFQPFYEVGSTTRHSSDATKFMGGGTGLGLSIVKGIIERHGGIIWAESDGARRGEFLGSEFHIVLPLKAKIKWDDDETKRLKLKKIMGLEKKETKRAKPRDKKPVILIIDDEKEALEISSMILESSFEILTAETGEEGLRMAFEHKPSLILLDAYLPGLDGYRICRILRTQDDTKDIPIAFFSAATQDNEIEMCYACGGDDFIVKPFSSKEMLAKVNKLLGIKEKKK
jgi:CheY-like chemotaxis protein